MTRHLISSGSPFEATLGYSRALVAGDWCFVAGTTGYDYATMAMPGDALAQARNALATIAGALGQAGFAMADVVRVTYYLTDAAHMTVIAPALADTFGTIRPAATMLVTGLVSPAMLLEIEVTAYRA
jgi:enamine deaminase RidA (YjgF/YER057c/UK114 family)